MTSSAAESIGAEQGRGGLRKGGPDTPGHFDELGQDVVELLLILDAHAMTVSPTG